MARTVATVLLVGMSAAAGPSLQAALATSTAGATTRVMADGVFTIDAPLAVGPGQTLVVRNATLLLDHRNSDSCVARGCDTPQVFLDGGTLRVERSTLRTTLDPTNDRGWSLVGHAATLDVVDSAFERFDVVSLQVAGAARSLVARTEFSGGASGILFTRGAEVDFVENHVHDVARGLVAHDGSSLVKNNHFQRVAFPSRAIDVQSTVVGERALVTLPRVVGNVVEDGYWGMLSLNGFPNEIVGNTFRNNTMGLSVVVTIGERAAQSAPPVVARNVFERNAYSMFVGLSGRSDARPHVEVALRDNLFLQATCGHVDAKDHAEATLTVDARENWWGSPLGPAGADVGCAAVVAGVDVRTSPWLTAAP